MTIELTAGQAVTIHGWLNPMTRLTWNQVLLKPKLSFDVLKSYNLSDAALFRLQPDLSTWIREGRACLKDCPHMKQWSAHPIRDFKADLADIVLMRWSAEVLVSMGVTYDDLVKIGLLPESMGMFKYTLMMWASIGFMREHAEGIPPPVLFRMFDMAKPDVLASLKSKGNQ